MLQAGKVKATTYAWPTSGNRNTAVGAHPKKGAGSDESDSEDRVPVPLYQESFGSAIQKALDDLAADQGN